MAVYLTNGAEGGTSGTAVSATNSGGESGNLFDSIFINAGTSLTFDNAQAAHGSLSYKVSTGSTSTTCNTLWFASFSSTGVTKAWFRQYLYFTANPAGLLRVVSAQDDTGQVCSAVSVTTSGTLQMLNHGSGTIFTTTNTIPLNQWFRIEGYVIGSATTGQVELKLFKTMDSTTPDEVQTSNASQNTFNPVAKLGFGINANIANAGPFWMDDLGASDTGYLGPAPAITPGVYRLNSFEGGTSGTALTQASGGNTGGMSGNFFDFTPIGTGCTLAFDNTVAAHGTLSCKVATSSTSASVYTEWAQQLTASSIATCWWRGYFYLTALPAAAFRLVNIQNGSTLCAGINVLSTGAFRVVNTSAGAITTSTTVLNSGTLPLSQWFRLEGYVNTASGTTELKIFASMDSTTATETDTSGSGQSISTQITNVRFGPTGASIGPYWQDDLGVSDTGYLGPANWPAALTGAGAISASGDIPGGASLAGTGAVAAPPVTLVSGASLAGQGALTAAVVQEAGAPLAGAGAVAAPPVTQEAGASLAGQGTATAPAEQAAGASVAGQGTVTAPAEQESGAVLAGSGSLTAPGATEAPATLTGQGSLTAGAVQEAGAPLAAAGSLTAGSGAEAGAALTGGGQVTATGAIPGGAPLTGAGQLAAPATEEAGAALAGAGAVAATGDIPGTAALAAAGSLAAHADTGAGAVLAGSGSLTAGAELEAGAILAGSGTVAAPAEVGAGVTLAGAGSLLVLAEQEAGAILAAAGFLTALGDIPGVAHLAGHGSLTAGSSVLYPVPGTVEAADYLAATAAAGDWLAAAVSAGDSAAATTGAYDSLV